MLAVICIAMQQITDKFSNVLFFYHNAQGDLQRGAPKMICFYGTVRLIMLNCLEGYEIRKTLSVHIALSLLQNHPSSFAEKAGKKQTLHQFPLSLFKYHLFSPFTV